MNLLLPLLILCSAQAIYLPYFSHLTKQSSTNPNKRDPETDHTRLQQNLKNSGLILGVVTIASTAMSYLVGFVPKIFKEKISVNKQVTATVTVTPHTIRVIQTSEVIVGASFTSTISGSVVTEPPVRVVTLTSSLL